MMVASPSKAQPPSAQHQVPTRARTKGLPLPRPGTWFGTPAAKKAKADEDFVMVSPHAQSSAMAMAMASSSPAEESPTPAARVSQEEEESPLRRVPGQSRSLSLGRPSLGKCSVDQGAQIFMAPPLKQKQRDENDWMRRPRNEPTIDSSPPPPPTPIHAHYSHQPPLPPPPQPRFPSIRNSHSHELSTASSSKSVRFDQSRQRATTDAERVRVLGQKKAVSLDNINIDAGAELFGDGFGVPIGSRTRKATSAHSLSSHSTLSGLPRHRRVVSGDAEPPTMISRSFGHKSGLALSLSPGLPAFSNSDSSLSSFSTANLTPPASTFSPAEPPIFEDVKPLASAFEPQSATVSRKFKPRDSGVGLEDECTKVESAVPPPSVSRPKHLKRPSDQAQLDIETPGFGPGMASGWPSAGGLGFDFLGQATSQLVSQAAAEASMDDKPHMPDTPVKKQAFVHAGSAARALPPSTSAKTALLGSARTSKQVLHLTLTTSSSPTAMEMDEQSPTVRAMIGKGRPSNGVASGSRVGMLRRQSSGAASSSESEEGTPTKSGTSTDRNLLGGAQPSLTTPSPSPKLAAQTSLPRTSTLQAGSAASLMPRLSLPAIQAPKLGRKLNHRQSHPLPRPTQTEDDIFEQRFITLEPLGKGAFSSVVKVQERHGDGVYAVKKAIGVFEGVKDRLRHLEEVDILRHLSRTPHPHVISFVDAWEQNRQLFIQTELCLGSLAFFLEEYGRVVPRLDEARVWKIIRELSDVSFAILLQKLTTGLASYPLQRCHPL